MGKNDLITVIAYGKEEKMTRKKAMDFYLDCAQWCEGAERDRYMTIYFSAKEGYTYIDTDRDIIK